MLYYYYLFLNVELVLTYSFTTTSSRNKISHENRTRTQNNVFNPHAFDHILYLQLGNIKQDVFIFWSIKLLNIFYLYWNTRLQSISPFIPMCGYHSM